MNIELKFKRPGGILLSVNSCKAGNIYVALMQLTEQCGHLAAANCVDPKDCELWCVDSRWTLEVRGVRFHLHPEEALQIQERFGFTVRHAKPEAQSCHP